MSPTPAKSTPKAPQDRKPKAEALSTKVQPKPDGWDLLRPLEEIPAWDQAPLLQTMYQLMDKGELDEEAVAKEEKLVKRELSEKEKRKFREFDLAVIGEMGRALLPLAKDEAEFTRWASGPGALSRVGQLAMVFLGELGESSGSES